MGWPMALRLRDAGHELTVLCRSEQAAARAAEAGTRPASTIAATCAGVELAIVCVFTDEQVTRVCLDPGGVVESVPEGATVVIHTTGSPTTAETIARAGLGRAVPVLDAPVSGGPNDIAAGAITLFVGGPDPVVAAARPALAAYGSPIIHAGPVGFGQRVKLVNNALFAANIGMTADAMRLGGELGVPDQVLIEALSAGSSGRPAIGIVSASGSVRRLAATVGEFVGKDVRVMRSIAELLGADLGVIGGVLSSDYVRHRVLNEADPVGQPRGGPDASAAAIASRTPRRQR
jgi:3-hydroxyisobutyrate dehydrogenase-like beta-hydroxyacid dehydrogenase